MKACPYCAGEILEAATVCTQCARDLPVTSPANRGQWLQRAVMTIAAVVALLAMTMFSSALLRAKPSNRPVGPLPERPINLTNVVKNVPADSWRVIPLNVPYSGVVKLDVGVSRGNPLNVFVTTPGDMQAMQNDAVSTVRPHPALNATKTMAFRGEARLEAGNYYLVLQDPSMGHVAVPASDVSIRADLRP